MAYTVREAGADPAAVQTAAAGRTSTALLVLALCYAEVLWASAAALMCLLIASETESEARGRWLRIVACVAVLALVQLVVMIVYRNARLIQGGTISSFGR